MITLVSPFKKFQPIVQGSFDGLKSQVISCDLFTKAYLFVKLESGNANIKIYQGNDKINWIQTHEFVYDNVSVIEEIISQGMFLKVEIEGSFTGVIQLVLSF